MSEHLIEITIRLRVEIEPVVVREEASGPKEDASPTSFPPSEAVLFGQVNWRRKRKGLLPLELDEYRRRKRVGEAVYGDRDTVLTPDVKPS